jgi:hypothetical protein
MPALRAESRRRLVGRSDKYAKAFPAWIRLLPGFLAALRKVIELILDDVDEEI